MRMIITITALLSTFSAWAGSPATAGMEIKGFGVDAQRKATMTVRIDNADVVLKGELSPSATLSSSDGRILADCSAIGRKGEICLVRRDGGNGAVALFKAIPNGFALLNKNLVLANAGDTLDQLVDIINSHSATPDQAIASLNVALSKGNTIAQVIDAYQALPDPERAIG